MRYSILFLLFTLTLVPVALQAGSSGVHVQPATLLHSYWLDGSEGLDVSGLSFCNGRLLAVSDKKPSSIYTIELAGQRGRFVPDQDIRLEVPDGPWEGVVPALLNVVQEAPAADFEGISCSDEGTIYLVSERHHRIAAYRPDSGEVEWLPAVWALEARRRGFMQHFNGAAEGVVVMGKDVWVALERDQRGLVQFKDAQVEPRFHQIPAVAGLDFKGRSEDVAGLFFYDGALYTLERNASAVCRRGPDDLEAEWCLDYRHIEEGPEYVYQDTEYGKGEGLAINEKGIFVVLDNNNVARAAEPEDRRGLLLHLAHPALGSTD